MPKHNKAVTALLERELPSLLPAGAAVLSWLGSDEEAAAGCDLLYVQGRIDRLHALLVIGGGDLEPKLDDFCKVPANWRWLVVSAEELARKRGDLQTIAQERGLGLISHDTETLQSVLPPLAQAGIFRKQYPKLRKAWKELSSW